MSASLRLPSSVLGSVLGPHEQTIDARWLMAYAAALGETDDRYFDTGATGGPAAHPLFAVCYEWPWHRAGESDRRAIAPFSVHATHDLVSTPAARGRRLSTTALVDVRPVKRAAWSSSSSNVDGAGAPVTTTHTARSTVASPVTARARPRAPDPRR